MSKVRLKVLLMMFVIAFAITGCGGVKVVRVSIDTGITLKEGELCPTGETCLTDVNTGDSLAGGGVGRSIILTGGECVATHPSGAPLINEQGNFIMIPCRTQNLATGVNPSHIDTLGGAVLGAGAQIGSAFIQKSAIKYSSRKQAEAVEDAAPGFVQIISQGQNQGQSATPIALSEGGNSSSMAGTNTNVGVGVEQSSSGCTGNNCFDPTQY